MYFQTMRDELNWSNHMKRVKTEHGGLLDSHDKRKDWTDDLVTLN